MPDDGALTRLVRAIVAVGAGDQDVAGVAALEDATTRRALANLSGPAGADVVLEFSEIRGRETTLYASHSVPLRGGGRRMSPHARAILSPGRLMAGVRPADARGAAESGADALASLLSCEQRQVLETRLRTSGREPLLLFDLRADTSELAVEAFGIAAERIAGTEVAIARTGFCALPPASDTTVTALRVQVLVLGHAEPCAPQVDLETDALACCAALVHAASDCPIRLSVSACVCDPVRALDDADAHVVVLIGRWRSGYVSRVRDHDTVLSPAQLLIRRNTSPLALIEWRRLAEPGDLTPVKTSAMNAPFSAVFPDALRRSDRASATAAVIRSLALGKPLGWAARSIATALGGTRLSLSPCLTQMALATGCLNTRLSVEAPSEPRLSVDFERDGSEVIELAFRILTDNNWEGSVESAVRAAIGARAHLGLGGGRVPLSDAAWLAARVARRRSGAFVLSWLAHVLGIRREDARAVVQELVGAGILLATDSDAFVCVQEMAQGADR